MDAIVTNVFLCVFNFFVIWFRRDQISSSSFLSGMFEHIYPSERSVYIKHDEYGLERGCSRSYWSTLTSTLLLFLLLQSTNSILLLLLSRQGNQQPKSAGYIGV